MLMYIFHIAFGVGLIALIMGLNMCCTKGSCEGGKCGKFFGFIIVIVALISVVCTGWTGINHMMEGKMKGPMHMMQMDGDMMKKNDN